MGLRPDVDGYLVERRKTLDGARPPDTLTCPGVDPFSNREIEESLVGSRFDDWCDQQVVAEQVLERVPPDLGIIGPFEEERPHKWKTMLNGLAGLGDQVRQKPFPELRELLKDNDIMK